MCFEEECILFGLHFEPMCYGSQEIKIHVLKKQASHIHAHQSRHTHASHVHIHDTIMLECTLVHIVIVRAPLQNFVMIEYMF